jgi:GH24 family phage-related lysozyme (muramidase)
MQDFNNLTDFIKSFETCSTVPYYATEYEKAGGVLTLGFGKTFKEDCCPTSCTVDQAHDWLKADLDAVKERFQALGHSFKTQYQEDAAASLAYNSGFACLTAFRQYLKVKNYNGAAYEFMNVIYQNKAPMLGLILRRCSEFDMFSTGVYHRIYEEDGILQRHRNILMMMNQHNEAARDLINSIKIRQE